MQHYLKLCTVYFIIDCVGFQGHTAIRTVTKYKKVQHTIIFIPYNINKLFTTILPGIYIYYICIPLSSSG